jgi:glycerol-3-phosphate acyltransferase PlsX
VGTEDSKGNETTKETFKLLEKSGLNFVGNVEGHDLFEGKVDVVVCDGFVGNVVLKVSEGVGEMMYSLLRREAGRSPTSAVGLLLAKRALAALKQKADYAEYGGAPLLGVRGACLVGHGRSNPKAIRNALRVAHSYATHGVVAHIERRLKEVRASHGSKGV